MHPVLFHMAIRKNKKKLIKFQGVRQRGNLGSHDINDKFKENIKNSQAVQESKRFLIETKVSEESL